MACGLWDGIANMAETSSRARAVRSPSVSSTVSCIVFQAEDGIRDLTVTGVQTCLRELDKDSVCSGALSIGNAPARLSFRLVVLRLRPLLTCSGRSFSVYDARDARDHKACLLGGGGQLHRLDGVRTNHRYRRRWQRRRPQGGRHDRALPAVSTAVSGDLRTVSTAAGRRTAEPRGRATGTGSSRRPVHPEDPARSGVRSEEHTSELQSQSNLVCRLLLEKKKEFDDLRMRREIRTVSVSDGS